MSLQYKKRFKVSTIWENVEEEKEAKRKENKLLHHCAFEGQLPSAHSL